MVRAKKVQKSQAKKRNEQSLIASSSEAAASASPEKPQLLRYMGFCGIDDSVSPAHLHLVSAAYPWVEWGILFRTDKEGQPRYPTFSWVEKFTSVQNLKTPLNVAGHLCGDRCQQLLDGDYTFISVLQSLGIRRIQINATVANAVVIDEQKFPSYRENLTCCAKGFPSMEFILQCNDETKVLWEPLILDSNSVAENVVLLVDASCGTGKRIVELPNPYTFPGVSSCGYAGGIGPRCIGEILSLVEAAVSQPVEEGRAFKGVWIDMESSLRSLVLEDDKEGSNSISSSTTSTSTSTSTHRDVFSVDKCLVCIEAGLQVGMPRAQ